MAYNSGTQLLAYKCNILGLAFCDCHLRLKDLVARVA